MSWFRDAPIEAKADGSVVTEADRACEAVLVEGLQRYFPGYGIVGEEGAAFEGDLGTWYVDPIDGTSSFTSELAYWGPSVGLVKNGDLEVGALCLPRLSEFWYAERGAGAWRNSTRLSPPKMQPLHSNAIAFFPSRFHRAGPIPWIGKTRAIGSAAAQLALVAGGSGCATIIPRWSLWDVSAGALMIRESGRVLIGLDGEPFDPVARTDEPFIACEPHLTEEFANMVSSVLRTRSRTTRT